MERRDVASRSSPPIRRAAAWLARTHITPNQISAFSAVIALLVPLGLLVVGGWIGALLAIAGIQLRLLANVIDGLVAVEGGKRSPLGGLYNEFPDRIADSVILVSLGYAGVATLPQAEALGWLAALLAALTAYVRVFGGALGQPQAFFGPMAKQHRMAVATIAIAVAACMPEWRWHDLVVAIALGIIAAGSALTCWTRTRHVARLLREGAAA